MKTKQRAPTDRNALLAEREGFEPSIPLRVYMISSHARSTTLPPLREAEASEKYHFGV